MKARSATMENSMPTEAGLSVLVLFINASAGSGEAEALLELWEQLVPSERLGPVFCVRDTATYDQELQQALTHCEKTGAVLTVAGGDGTLNGVLKKAPGRGITLGLIPTGTFNFFARSHGIPEDPREAIESLLSAAPTTLPLAYVNGQPFIVSVSLGLHPKVIAEREVHTRYVGRTRLAAWLSGIWTIIRARHITRATVITGTTRREIKTPLLMVNFNSAQLLGLDHRFQFRPEKLAVLRLKPGSFWALLIFIIRGISGRVLDEQSLECEYVSDLAIELRRSTVRVALDGELVKCHSALRFHVQIEGFSCLLQGPAS